MKIIKRRKDGVVQSYHILGSGHSANVIDIGKGRALKKFKKGIHENPNITKNIEFNNKYIRLQLYKYDVIVPVKWSNKGLIMPKLNVAVRNVKKEEWRKYNKNFSVKVRDIDKKQVLRLMNGLRELSNAGIRFDDYLEVGLDKNGKAFYIDIGGLAKSDVLEAKDTNSRKWDKFVEIIGYPNLKGKLFRKEEDNYFTEIRKEINFKKIFE